jgi:hypothetical protein
LRLPFSSISGFIISPLNIILVKMSSDYSSFDYNTNKSS